MLHTNFIRKSLHKELRLDKFGSRAEPGVLIKVFDCHSTYKI